jgi:eukaryotic-like serine/threonine-protein kinase
LLEIFCKVLDAVEYAHASGIIHLDLKPSNIQVSDYGEVLVCDWGLAKIIDSDCDGDFSLLDDTSLVSSCVNFLTIDGFFKGTPGFMAPEQTRGQLVRKDCRTDIYSLGCILYTLLTYEDPIVGKDVDEIVEGTKTGTFERPRLRCPQREIPASIEAVVMKAMATNPENRYLTSERMHKDIDSYRTGFATRAEEAGFFTQLRLVVRRNPKVSVTIAIASLLITAVVTYTNEELRYKERTARAAQQEAEINLAKYKREREWRTRNEAAPDYYNRALENFKSFRLNDAMEQVGIALDYDPRLYRAWELKGNLHFAFMEFKAAAEAYKKAENPTGKQWSTYAHTFSKVNRNTQGRVSVDNLIKILGELGAKKRTLQVRYMVREYMQYEIPMQERLRMVRGLSKVYASDPDNYTFKYQERPEGLHIDLSRNKETVFTEFLVGLPIIHINLSGSNVKDLSPLRGMPLQVLDLSRTTGLTSLDDLVGMQIDVLDVSHTDIQRIEALRGMHFQLLDISGMRRANVRWLEMLRANCIIQTLVITKRHYNSPGLISELEGWTVLVDQE